MMKMQPIAMTVLLLAQAMLASACTTQHVADPRPVTVRYVSWEAHQRAHPNARYVVVYRQPIADRSCWKIPRGWRCVAR